ncbi:MAG: hypothetical protein KY466_09765, partial [Gemmatimonadetes bacterium]|nr:hypothetical protein [Gemmatimonadota bacterium]
MISVPIRVRTAAVALVAAALAACATAPEPVTTTPEPVTRVPTISAAMATVPDPDPRVGLRAGRTDAGQAIWNMRLLSNTPTPEPFTGVTNSDLAFLGDYAIQGNYNGFQVWDISDP